MLERVWRKRNPLALLVGMSIDTATMENSMEVPQKTKNRTTSNSISEYMSGKMKTLIWEDTCTPIFIAALFTIANIWKQIKCLSTDKLIKKKWNIYTMEYYSAIKRNEILPFSILWIDLENIMLSEVSQTEKDKYCMILFICGI